MYKTVGLFLICWSFSLNSSVNNSQDLFSKANQAYKQSEFEKAYELYQKVTEKSAYVNYNLGNCAYKLEKYGYAMLYWKRAEQDWGFWNRQELLDNIYLLKKKLNGSSKVEDRFAFFYKSKSFFVSIVRNVPIFYLQLLFLIFWVFLFLYIRRLYKSKRKFLIILLFSFVALFGTLLVIKYSLENRVHGVVVNPKTQLLSGPGRSFQEIGVLPQASEFIINRESDGFYKIKFYKQIGWISKKDVQKV